MIIREIDSSASARTTGQLSIEVRKSSNRVENYSELVFSSSISRNEIKSFRKCLNQIEVIYRKSMKP